MLRRVTLGAVSPARPRDLLGLDELVDGAVRLLLRQALRIRLGLLGDRLPWAYHLIYNALI